MRRLEAEFSTKFGRWAKHFWPISRPAYFEFKISQTESLLFSAISEKQYRNLQLEKFYFKFSDFDRMGTPFDGVCFSGEGLVVIQYNAPKNKEFVILPISVVIAERAISKRKSLTLSRAYQLGQVYRLGELV